MSKALESFTTYVITESYKGPEQLRRIGLSANEKPQVFTKTFKSASAYDHPEFMESDSSGLSPEESDELKSMGFANSNEIEYLSIPRFKLTYDIMPMWDDTGITGILFIPKKASMRFEIETWDEEKDESITTYFDSVDDNIGDRFEWDFAREPFPLEPTSVEVHMNNSFDPSKFSYEFTIGEWQV